MNEAAKIQKESRWSLEAIKSLHSTADYQIYKNTGSVPTQMADGSWALLREIDWKAVDSSGRSNVERVGAGLAPIDSAGMPYELHHIGMKADSPLEILTKTEHHSKENYLTLHWAEEGKNVADEVWDKQRKAFWKEVLNRAMDVGIY